MGHSLQKFMGGSPIAVIIKLVLISLLVGAFMSFLDINPSSLLRSLTRLVQSVLDLGFEAVGEVGQWVIYGAMIVVPLWLLSRIFKIGS